MLQYNLDILLPIGMLNVWFDFSFCNLSEQLESMCSVKRYFAKPAPAHCTKQTIRPELASCSPFFAFFVVF